MLRPNTRRLLPWTRGTRETGRALHARFALAKENSEEAGRSRSPVQALFRQPGSFKGFLSVAIVGEIGHEAVLEPGQDRKGISTSTPLSFPEGSDSTERQHPIAQITEIVAVDRPAVQEIDGVHEPIPDRVDSGHLPLEFHEPVLEPDLRVRVAKRALDVTAVEPLYVLLEPLDVLLRHGPWAAVSRPAGTIRRGPYTATPRPDGRGVRCDQAANYGRGPGCDWLTDGSAVPFPIAAATLASSGPPEPVSSPAC